MDWAKWIGEQLGPPRSKGRFGRACAMAEKVGITPRWVYMLANHTAISLDMKWRFAQAYPELRVSLLAELGFLK